MTKPSKRSVKKNKPERVADASLTLAPTIDPVQAETLGRAAEIASALGLKVLPPPPPGVESYRDWLELPATQRYLGFIAETAAGAAKRVSGLGAQINARLSLPAGTALSSDQVPLSGLAGSLVREQAVEGAARRFLQAAAEQRWRTS